MSDSIKINLQLGKCQEVLKNYPDNHFDCVITDPPYGLGVEPDPVELMRSWIQEEPLKGGRGFMGATWDATVPSPSIFREILRVVKPGGVSCFFAGTRTLHLMMASLRIAGWEIEGVNAWVQGCFSEDTDILTPNGWVKGVDVKKGDYVAAWDSATEKIDFVPVQHKILSPFKGNMVSFKNDNTDQLLTPNHRVYAKFRHRKQVQGIRTSTYDKEWNVKDASEIDRYSPITVPLAGIQEGIGIGGVDLAALLGWVWTEGGFDNKGTVIRLYQSSTNMEHVLIIQDLLKRMSIPHSEYTRERKYKDLTYIEYSWYMSGEIASRVQNLLPDKSPTWELIFQMTLEEKKAFFNAAMLGDGSLSALAFYQKKESDLEKMQTLAHLMGMHGRINSKKSCVALHRNPTTQIHCKTLKESHEIPYQGLVWCVTVETGAIMVRRNGRIFISGNSGFPKSMNINKALTKRVNKRYGDSRCSCEGCDVYSEESFVETNVLDRERTEPRRIVLDDYEGNVLTTRVCSWCALPCQAYLDSTTGLGTSLKPSFEPLVVCRAPHIPIVHDYPELLAKYGFSPEQIEFILEPS